MKHAYEILLSLHHVAELSVSSMLSELETFSRSLTRLSPNLDHWLLAGDTKQEALMYPAFDQGAPATAAQAVLEAELRGTLDPRIVTLWNGREGHAGASLRLLGRPPQHISLVTFVGRPESFSADWRAIADVLVAGISIWKPHYVTLESNGYDEHKTFKDRPGVGWMLYLPRVLTTQQVPEARALIPVLGSDEKQTGTIIVSVTDAPFSDKDPEHVKIANAIEIRLVDQDLLPRYADL